MRTASHRTALLAVALGLLAVLAGCGGGSTEPGGTACEVTEPESLVAAVVRTLPHDTDAYTQGLVVSEGRLYESTGLEGSSTLRVHDLSTGVELERVALDPDVFGEGLAIGAEGRLVQLTWKNEVAYEWDPEQLEVLRRFSYEGEGWGLTTLDDGTLVMSDGSDELAERDPHDFRITESYRIRRAGGDADLLNELEWDGEALWANRYQTDELVRIDRSCRMVTGVVDLSDLTRDAEEQRADGDPPLGVSNGIAHLPGTDRYLLTGKNWPTMYEVRIQPSAEDTENG